MKEITRIHYREQRMKLNNDELERIKEVQEYFASADRFCVLAYRELLCGLGYQECGCDP